MCLKRDPRQYFWNSQRCLSTTIFELYVKQTGGLHHSQHSSVTTINGLTPLNLHFRNAKSTQLDILRFVFMSACYLSDLRLNIGPAASCCDARGAVIFPPLKDTTLSEVWERVGGWGDGGRGWPGELEKGEGERKRWLLCDKRPVPSSRAWETGSAAHKALLWRRGNARSSKIRAPIWLSVTRGRPLAAPRRPYPTPQHTSPPSTRPHSLYNTSRLSLVRTVLFLLIKCWRYAESGMK